VIQCTQLHQNVTYYLCKRDSVHAVARNKLAVFFILLLKNFDNPPLTCAEKSVCFSGEDQSVLSRLHRGTTNLKMEHLRYERPPTYQPLLAK